MTQSCYNKILLCLSMEVVHSIQLPFGHSTCLWISSEKKNMRNDSLYDIDSVLDENVFIMSDNDSSTDDDEF